MLYTRYVKNLIAGCLIVASGSIVATIRHVPSVDYPTLRDAVYAAVSDDTIEITDDINGSSADNHDVIIDGKTLTIVGNERIIDLGEVGRLFNIRNSSNVTIQNLTIQKGNSDNGGAIYNDSDSRLTVNNCTFSINTATSNGGAIYNVSGSTLTVSDCTFGSNRTTGSMSDGGAIYNAGTATFTLNDSRSFSNNTATGNGGAISNSGNLTITGNYTFGDNNAFYDGGAISNSGTLTITACTFNINDAISGGAISSTGSLTLTNCIFSGNSTEAYGAAISSSSTLNITGCTFSGNSAATRGGAVKSSGTLNITGCTFSSNSATNHGGVIFNDSGAGPLTITSCTFSGNSADYGGVLVNINDSATITCSCSRFVNNTATTSGSAIYNNGNIVTATNNWWGTEDSGTISSLFSGTGTVNYSPWITMSLVSTHPLIGATATITVDFASSGTTCTIPTAPITFSTTDGTVTPTESLVIDGTATASFVATNTTARVCAQVDSETECVYSGLLIVDLYGTYTNIQAAINDAQSGDTIYITAGQTFSGTGNYNITITKNLTFDRIGEGDDPVIDLDSQGRLFTINEGQTVSIHNLNIQKGRSDSGGAILNYGTATLQGCSFSFNYVTGHGGAIFCAGTATLTVTGCTFDTNEATIIGGAIYNRGIATLEDSCSFIGNRAANGGAVYSDYRLTVNGCTFKGNSANNGGVLYNIGSGSSISCSRLVNNTASSSGSAIYTTVSFTAENNWWGTNDDPGTVSNLFAGGGTVDYSPYITMSLSADPSTIAPGGTSTIGLNFSNTCIPTLPVAFSTTDGTVYPTLAEAVEGSVSCEFNAARSDLLRVVGTAGPDDENYSLTLTLTPDPVTRSILLTKSALPVTVDHAGQLISYTYTVSNAGNVYLNDVLLTDNKLIPTFNPPNPLNPGETATGTATYIVLQSDMDAGIITNEATVTGTTEAGIEVTHTVTETVDATQNPGLSIIKKIEDKETSTTKPGVVVALGSTIDISYLVTNTGNVTLNVEVTDDQGYTIEPSTTTLAPDESITCTTQWYAPAINELHQNIGTATGTTALSTVVTASASAYATSIPANPYRFNFGCICSDTGEEHILIGSHNMPTLDGNRLDFWTFDAATPTASSIGSLNLGQQIIMDSATYNTEAGMNIVVLTQTQEGDTALVLVTYDGTSAIARSTTPLSSQAFKAQWFVSSNGTPYIVADTQDGMSLYEVDLTSYTVTLSSSVPNLGAGMPSAFLRWYPQGDSLYVIQGYNQTSIATYKVDLTVPEIQAGITTEMEEQFMFVNSCATCYEDLVLGGAGSGEEALLVRCTVGETGELTITQTASIPGAVYIVNYCERCCCGDNPILVGTDNGLYSLKASDLSVEATFPGGEWINTCWCCDVTGDYCIAVNSAHETYVFQQVDDSLTQVLQLPSEFYPTSQEGVTEEEPAVDPTEPTEEPVVEIPEEGVPE